MQNNITNAQLAASFKFADMGLFAFSLLGRFTEVYQIGSMRNDLLYRAPQSCKIFYLLKLSGTFSHCRWLLVNIRLVSQPAASALVPCESPRQIYGHRSSHLNAPSQVYHSAYTVKSNSIPSSTRSNIPDTPTGLKSMFRMRQRYGRKTVFRLQRLLPFHCRTVGLSHYKDRPLVIF